MTETVIFSLFFARLKGYKWSEILKPFKHWTMYPIVLICLVHIYFIYLMINEEYWFVQYSNYIKTTSFLFYFTLIWKYKLLDISVFSKIENNKDKKPLLTLFTSPVSMGALCIVVGTILNKIAIAVNNFKMPVFPNVSYGTGYIKMDMFNKMLQFKDFHVLGSHETNLIFLTDIFDGFFTIMSWGDIISRLFVVLIIYYSIKQCKEQKIKN